jgi:hypothetical protein
MAATRKVTVTYEGTDAHDADFTFAFTVPAHKTGDNPRFYAEQMAEAAAAATESIRESVEAVYGSPPVS